MKKPIVLAYSGGFRSSVGLASLADEHGAGVVTVTLGLGQSTDLIEIRDRALAAGAIRAHVVDARDEFARDFAWPSLRADALSDGRYPMATALSRPLIAKQLVELARIEGATMVAHGAVGRDAARMQQCLRTLDGTMQAVACADGLTSAQAVDYAGRLGRSVPPATADRLDDNLWGRTIGCSSDDASGEATDAAFKLSRNLAQTPNTPAVVELSFEHGTPTGINGVPLRPVELIESLTTIAGEHGIGRFDRVKSRTSGVRSRVLYEAPAAAVLHDARRELERLTSSDSQNRFSTAVAAAYANALGRGEWFDHLRVGLDAYVASTQEHLTGTVRVKLFKGVSHIVGRTLTP